MSSHAESGALPRASRRRLAVGAGVLALAAGTAIALVSGVFGGSPGSEAKADGVETALATVARQTLTSQTQVSATLGYAGAASIVQPAGTSPSALLQAKSAVTTAQGQLDAARSGLAADVRAFESARARLAADRAKRAVDCAGGKAAQSAPSGSGADAGSGSGACAADQSAVASDEGALTAAVAKVAGDRQSATAAAAGLAGARTSLASARASASAAGESASFTWLPEVGQVVTRGHQLYRVADRPVLLLYGPVAAWRAFVPGMAPGRDVAELNANLRALGFGRGLAGPDYGAATTAAVRAFQSAHGLEPTGRLLLGSVIFHGGAVRVTKVTPTVGAAVQPGPVLDVTSTVRRIAIQLDAGQQAGVKVGDPVTITLPDTTTTSGVVSSVGTVATTPSGDGNGGASESPTIDVEVRPSDPAATGRLDQAPVTVAITTATAKDAIVVPVASLLALAGGGYAVEEVTAGGVHRLVPVTLGLFDDAGGLVEVTDTTLEPGRRIVVPAA